MEAPLSDKQLEHLAAALHVGAQQASQSMAAWLAVPSLIEIDSVDQLPICDAADVLGPADQALCFCSLEMTGSLTGQIILAFDDECGLSLTDLLLDHPIGSATEWSELERSAALETTNIIGSAYLNSLAKHLSRPNADAVEILPSPPTFRREFAGSLLQTAFMGQAMASDFVFSARSIFEIRGESLNWTMLFVPDGPSMERLAELMDHVV